MANPHIPNINTLRSSRPNGPGRVRGRGLAGSSREASSDQDKAIKDKVIQQTDQDASVSRLSAVEVGYLDDSFAAIFNTSQSQRRFPIINRGDWVLFHHSSIKKTNQRQQSPGTYIRTCAIDNLVNRFLSSLPLKRKQIISLGAGSDTRFFRLAAKTPEFPLLYHELDFPAITTQKVATITQSPVLTGLIPGPVSISATDLHSQNYHIHSIDLRTLDPSQLTPSQLPHVDRLLPTLIISECCLIYLPPSIADAVATYFTKTLFPHATPLGMILYEPINPHDAFGKVMVSNLAARGIELQTLKKYGSLATQKERLKGYGFGSGAEGGGGIGVADVNFLWDEVNGEEKDRVASLEMMDEVEEWRLLAGHYCVVWGWRNGLSEAEMEGFETFWEKWIGVAIQDVQI